MTPFTDPKVAAAYDALPKDARAGALILRELILDTAASLPRAQPLQEALRWQVLDVAMSNYEGGEWERIEIVSLDTKLSAFFGDIPLTCVQQGGCQVV